MVTWRLDINSGKRRRSEEKISMLRQSKLFQSIFVPSRNSRTFRRKCCWSCIVRQSTVTERIYRVHPPRREREWIEFHNQKWINSRRKTPQKKNTSGLLHYSEDGRLVWHGRNSMRSYETKDRAIQEHMETLSKIRFLVTFEARSRERLAILPNTITCSRSLQHTICSSHWESGMCEDTGWALPEVSLNSESATCCIEIELAIWSTRSSSSSKSYGETCNNTVDYRISGVPLSAVEQQDTTRENEVKTHKIIKFSKESKDLIADLNNTEIFELYENSSKQQCLDCNAYWEIGIIHCSCGRNIKSSQSPTTRTTMASPQSLDMWLRRTAVVEPNTDLPKDKGCTTRRIRCWKRPVSKSTDATQRYFHDGTPVNRTETRCMPSGGEKDTKCCTTESPWRSTSTSQQELRELKNSKHWILTLKQQPLNQRPDFAQAKRECTRLHDEHLARTQEEYRTIPSNQ